MEIQELLQALDVDIKDDASVADFKQAFFSKYVSREIAPTDKEIVSAVNGRTLDALERNFKRHLKAAGLDESKLQDFSFESLKEDDPETNPIIALGDTYRSQIERLKKDGEKGNSQKIAELQEKLEHSERDKHSYENLLKQTKTEFEEFKETATQKQRDWLINQQRNEAFKKFKLSDSVDEIRLRGFESVFNEKYNLTLEDDKVVVLDKNSGERVPNNKSSGLATLEDVYEQELSAHKMLKKNNAGEEGSGGAGEGNRYDRYRTRTQDPKVEGRINKAQRTVEQYDKK